MEVYWHDRKPREMHVTTKTTWYWQKWDEGDNQRETHIQTESLMTSNLSWQFNSMKEKHSLTKPQCIKDRMLAVTHKWSPPGSISAFWMTSLHTNTGKWKLLHVSAFIAMVLGVGVVPIKVCRVCERECYLLVIGSPDTTSNLAF